MNTKLLAWVATHPWTVRYSGAVIGAAALVKVVSR